MLDSNAHDRELSASLATRGTQTPVIKTRNGAAARHHTFTSPISEEVRIPLENLTNYSCSGDWSFPAGDKSESVCQPRKLRRLRKLGDVGDSRNLKTMNERLDVSTGKLGKSFCDDRPVENKTSKGI